MRIRSTGDGMRRFPFPLWASQEADGTKRVTLICPDAQHVGIWSPVQKNAPSICLEPWLGRCDNKGFTGELKDK